MEMQYIMLEREINPLPLIL